MLESERETAKNVAVNESSFSSVAEAVKTDNFLLGESQKYYT